MNEEKFYSAKELLNYPHLDQKTNQKPLYNAIIIVPTGEIRVDNGGYPEFAIIGCYPDLIPKEIITYVHALQFNFILDCIKSQVKIDMVGPNLVRCWLEDYRLTFNLTSSEDMSFNLVKIKR